MFGLVKAITVQARDTIIGDITGGQDAIITINVYAVRGMIDGVFIAVVS